MLQKQKSTKRNDSQKAKKDLAKNRASRESLQDSDNSGLDHEEEKIGGQPKMRSTSTTQGNTKKFLGTDPSKSGAYKPQHYSQERAELG